MAKSKINLHKPIYIGFAGLELSKLLMYEFHYEYMKPKYNENRTRIVLFMILEKRILMKILKLISKNYLILRIIKKITLVTSLQSIKK